MKFRNMVNFKNRGKYKNMSCNVDGHFFHSRLEAAYYGQLKIEKKAGLILDFERQVSFDLYAWNPHDDLKLECSRKKVGCHIVDFLVTLPDGTKEVREVKGFETDTWHLKHKIFEANYPNLTYKVIRG